MAIFPSGAASFTLSFDFMAATTNHKRKGGEMHPHPDFEHRIEGLLYYSYPKVRAG